MNIQTERLVIVPYTEIILEKIPNDEIGPHIYPDSTLLGWGVWIVLCKDKGEFVGDIGFKGKPNKKTNGRSWLWNKSPCTEQRLCN